MQAHESTIIVVDPSTSETEESHGNRIVNCVVVCIGLILIAIILLLVTYPEQFHDFVESPAFKYAADMMTWIATT